MIIINKEEVKLLQKKWFVIYTKPRWEKKVYASLLKKDVEVWCPVQKVQKQWSDRKKIIEEPLFKSYLFVQINYTSERLRVLMTDGALNFVHYLGKPAIIRDQEIDIIKRYLNEEKSKIDIISSDGFKKDSKVKINTGVFIDQEGTIIRTGKRRVYVELKSLGQVMIVEFNIDSLVPA
ncbi:MAG: UpxY family transcription antiterminator [Deinococcales bacterium]|nr:UpxY family transcription antiterminator [Chitinophagaceae bacterium]